MKFIFDKAEILVLKDIALGNCPSDCCECIMNTITNGEISGCPYIAKRILERVNKSNESFEVEVQDGKIW